MLMTAFALAIAVPCAAQTSSTPYSVEDDTRKVKAILKRIDADVTDTSIYSDDVVHMAQGSRPITSKPELRKVLEAEASHGRSNMTHEVVTVRGRHIERAQIYAKEFS